MKILTIWTGFLAAFFAWTLQPEAIHKDPVFLSPEETARRLKAINTAQAKVRLENHLRQHPNLKLEDE